MNSINHTCIVHPETLFLMADGTFKTIEEITEDDEIMTLDIETTASLDYKPSKISNKTTKMSEKLYQVKGTNAPPIKLTNEQLILAEFTFDVPFSQPSDKIYKGSIVYSFCKERKIVALDVIKDFQSIENEMVYSFTCIKNTFVTSSFVISNGEGKIFDTI